MPRENAIPLSIATCSLGSAGNWSLDQKLDIIAGAGFRGIELEYADLVSYAGKLSGSADSAIDVSSEDGYEKLVDAARAVNKQCQNLDLKVVMLQPFTHFEGWPDGSEQRKKVMFQVHNWIGVMLAVGTDMVQVGSSDSPNIVGGKQRLASDLGQFADVLAKHGLRLCYENWCWATLIDTWKLAWDIVQLANRPNLGICLDTFQMAGAEWGDPTTSSGRIEGSSESELRRACKNSLDRLASTVPQDKIYVLQIADAYKMDPPLANEVDESGNRPRRRWSQGFRALPYDGGYLPIEEIGVAVLNTGFRGWVSLEVFDDAKRGEEKQNAIEDYAHKAITNSRRFVDQCLTQTG